MRVIAGNHRGRRLIGPEDEQVTRPITDRVKTALFDRLAAATYFEDAVALDLFCGTGSMGIECLSRGASRVIFVDRDRTAIRSLQANLETFRETEKASVLSRDALGPALADALEVEQFTHVFCDPPYRLLEERPEAVAGQMANLARCSAANAVMVLRTKRDVEAPALETWAPPKTFGYGSMTLHFYDRL